jgi:hypothetical protein
MNDYKPEITVYYESIKREPKRNRFGVLISGLIKALYQENKVYYYESMKRKLI